MRTLAVCILPFALALPSLGQAVARQGTSADQAKSDFVSPMVLEIPMIELKGAEKWAGTEIKSLSRFVCEDVSLPLIRVYTGTKSGGKVTKISFETAVFVRPSHDRIVTLRFSFAKNGEDFGPSTECIIRGKENKERIGYSKMEISTSEYEELSKSEKTAFLKVVVTVKPD